MIPLNSAVITNFDYIVRWSDYIQTYHHLLGENAARKTEDGDVKIIDMRIM